ncbi:VWA domain-containing protein [Nonomuraea sp. NPDC049649]|uniref:vWA domain-containing protein n=1 Tax=Nonomuraea sp. NPDC049649 TaxID=3155776 RepID=UPI003427248F
MLAAVEGLIAELRAIGVPVSLSEGIDAVRVLPHVRLGDREEVRVALRAALVKRHEHEHAFDTVFDLFFSPAAAPPADPEEEELRETPGAPGAMAPGESIATLDDERLIGLLVEALRAEDFTTVRLIAGIFVDRHARIEPGRPVGGTYYLFRTMLAIDQDALLGRLLDDSYDEGPDGALARRLAVDRAEWLIDRLRSEVEAQIRRRLVADRGAEAVAKTLRTPLPQDMDFLTTAQKELAPLRATVRPLARTLAARLARRREHLRRGNLDFRRTVRRSMSTGGVPAQPVFRRPRVAKPELMVIADISGSVAAFATFTLLLVDALRSEFAAVRTFVFVDGVDEVTSVLAQASDIAEATAKINAAGSGVWLDGRSDYGNVLETFWERWGQQVTARTTVVVLGDARSNYHAPRAEALQAIARRAGHLYWLNPEPAGAWDSGDSVMSAYAEHCDEVFECRNVRQLKAFVDRLG